MLNDRKILISVGSHRRSVSWQPQTLLLSELYAKLGVPARGTETMREYLALKKSEQDDLKDVGGYVAGGLNGTRRKAGAVSGRDVLTLDLDTIPPGGTEDILRRAEGLGCGYCIYSTRKHSPAAPRLRVLLPLNRTVTADEYEPLARKMAELIGMEFADPTTFEVTRLMYWPSVCADGEYLYTYQDKPMLDADGLLALYEDWRDMTRWPRGTGESSHAKLAVKQGDPLSKNGVVGAFCRVYDVLQAMDVFLPGIYEPVEAMPGRYTYLGGSTAGGAAIYDGAKFLYSHHATDPCGGRLVNAFDLVRLHKFEGMDDNAPENAFGRMLPSYKAMCELALSDKAVTAQMSQDDFSEAASEPKKDELAWTADLDRGQNGGYEKTIKNIRLMIENLPGLTGVIRRDVFSGKIIIGGNPPWGRWAERRLWGDADTTALREFLEKWFKPSKQDIRDTLNMIADRRAFHPVRDYLTALRWDGVPRLDTVFVDYMSAPDTPYVRAVTRKSLVACAARVMNPGVKYDYMVVFVGSQGRGKSMLIDKLAVTHDWFSDSLATFTGKDAMESVQGKWLIEVPEMNAFDKAEMSTVKAFITKRNDYYRAAYAEFPEERPRQCVLFGTTNNKECLRDTTGNRRFWPIDAGRREDAKKSVYTELEHERDQIWAEAVLRWRMGETLYLPPDLEKEAAVVQEMHREAHPWEDTVIEFLNREVPPDWDQWSLDRRMAYWGGGVMGDIQTEPRKRVCCMEIWREAICKDTGSMNTQNARAIKSVLEAQEGWKAVGLQRCGKPYGPQRTYERREL